MILKIITWGNPVLRKDNIDIDSSFHDLPELINNMWETMENHSGIGLSAPQVGVNINLFIIDTTRVSDSLGLKKIFINPIIIEKSGTKIPYEEGCISFPGVSESIYRQENVLINYFDENFIEHEEWFDGINSRVIQHENDHLNGVLIVDHLTPIRRRLYQGKMKQYIKNSKIKK